MSIRVSLRKPVGPQQIYQHLEAVTSSSTARILLPKPVQPLHVYRHLLRVATYFPPVCRPHIEDRVRFSFRQERSRAADSEKKIPNAPNRKVAREREQYRRLKALEEGRRKVNSLNAAISGDLTRFRTVLWHCFGKLGKRRRQLMADFVQKPPQGPPLDSDQLEERITERKKEWEKQLKKKAELLKTPPTQRYYDRTDPTPWVHQKLSPIEDNWDTEKIKSFVNSQNTHYGTASSPAAWPRKPIDASNPMKWIPKTDSWRRPLAARRVTKIVRRWWKAVADKIMPPLGKPEWDLLQDVATGSAPDVLWTLPPRRPVAGSAAKKTDDSFNWAAYATIPIREVERSRSWKFARLTGKTDDGPYSRTDNRVRGHPAFSKRQLRREFTKIWQASAYEEAAGEVQKGKPRRKYVWGGGSFALPPASATQQQIFDGVDAKGCPIRSDDGRVEQ